MSITIDTDQAKGIVRDAAQSAEEGRFDQTWFKKIEKLSDLCAEAGSAKTHIAFFGTELIAKAVRVDVALFDIKPEHSDHPTAFSARTLCHSVLVPLSAELGIDIGVHGREPLNNQPYFRMTRLGDDTPVRKGAKAAFDYVVQLVRELDEISDSNEVREVLAAFIAERRGHQISYGEGANVSGLTVDGLAEAIITFVGEDAEGGRRAQAVVAGLLDVVAGPERVKSGLINDPSRKYPGDVCVASPEDPSTWVKAFEVRDKPVNLSDVQIFGRKCADMGVREAALVAVAADQIPLDYPAITEWCRGLGIRVSLFMEWPKIIDQTLFWADTASANGASLAAMYIRERLIAVEAQPETVKFWDELVDGTQPMTDMQSPVGSLPEKQPPLLDVR